MKPEYQLLYDQLLCDLEPCVQPDRPESEIAEHCYHTALRYWEELKEHMAGQVFASRKDETAFFREVKPKFTSLIEYYVMINEALLCIPAEPDQQRKFWNGEQKRYERFRECHEIFVYYYDSGRTGVDEIFFLRRPEKAVKSPVSSPLYDNDPELRTSHDGVIRSYLAHKMYHDYCTQKLTLLATS